MPREFCSVANQYCACPPSNALGVSPHWTDAATTLECYSCGQPCCRQCSNIKEYWGSKRRLCDNCQESIDGHARNVAAKAYVRAGYSKALANKVRRGEVEIGAYS